MPLFPMQRLRFLVFWALAPIFTLPAQNPLGPHQYDAVIARFLRSGQQDSFLYYSQRKCTLAQKSDSLELWAWELFDAYEAIETNPKQALEKLDKIWQLRWRDPQNAREWLPFLYIHGNRGWCLYELGKIWQSLQAYEFTAQWYERYPNPDFDALETVYKPLGTHYIRLGDNDKAIAVFQKALALRAENESLSGLYCDLGLAYWNKGDYVSAEENYRQGLTLPGIPLIKKALLLGALAQTQLDKGQNSEAAAIAGRSLNLLQSASPEDPVIEYRCYSRRTAGVAYTQLGQFKSAEQLLSAALADAWIVFGKHSRDAGKIEVARSQMYLKQGRLLPAMDAANRALSAVIPGFQASPNPLSAIAWNTPDKQTPSSSNPKPSQLYEENTIFEALSAKAVAAQVLFETSGNFQWLELALECHDLAWQAEAMLRRVYQYSSSKLNLQKEARTREEAAMHAARLLYEKTGQAVWLEKAFAIAERSKATILLEALQDNLARQWGSASDTRFTELTALRHSLSYFDKNLLLEPGSDKVAQWRSDSDGIRAQIALLEQTLRKAYPNLAGIASPTVHWFPEKDDLSTEEALVGYFISALWVDIFVFQNDKFTRQSLHGQPDMARNKSFGSQATWHRIPNDDALQALIQRYLAFYLNDYAILNDPNGYLQTAYALWQKLLPPETAHAAILTILPDGILNFVPFEAFVTSLDEKPNLRTAAYLIRRQALRYAWSLAVLRQQKSLKSKAPKYLLSIAPGFANHERGLTPLQATAFNWQGIVGWDIQNLNGHNAGLQHFLKAAGSFRVLHFSTHAFAGGPPRIELMDSSLLLPDLYALPLQADLVVLSACETGLGQEEKGEGVVSLSRAFAQAGAACIVSSLWSVNDQSTSRLLGYFYEQIKAGQSTAAALREAKLAYLADAEVGAAAQSPYFWAGVVMVGDDRVVEQPWGWRLPGLLLGIGLILTLLVWIFRLKFRNPSKLHSIPKHRQNRK
jgi:tetratricopeptide (TPR) repeat protein